jgi:hypothetical protein
MKTRIVGTHLWCWWWYLTLYTGSMQGKNPVGVVQAYIVAPARDSTWMRSRRRTLRSRARSFGPCPGLFERFNAETDTEYGPHGSDSRPVLVTRRNFLPTSLSIWGVTVWATPTLVRATTDDDGDSINNNPMLYTKRTPNYAYEFQPPSNFQAGNKPLKTHLDEANFASSSSSAATYKKGYQFGITVDPVRIQSLADFGTPEEVAAKVVLAELKRDGVFDVTLMRDPVATVAPRTNRSSQASSYYQLDYLSVGKRGPKRFVAKFYIADQMLYALTAQCLADDYEVVQTELLAAVDSFRIVDKQ